ncbi:hypothetical protein [Amycolatopsis saalfeldensis]|uniref:ABC-2 type transport system permease protein n=1 Tax=Amycolatopsis saalfeldensis TaxID=394193 RepID=A0A1H8RHX1_9PSEU|nr:hypothetical protein [Amycolatopsis saalfeldensis]SEO66005.1 hypothetical protein SAMN04489732_101802 [Amycolatopsis saalfeldensis]
MRWMTLYVRSRQVPASLLALVICTVGIRLASGSQWSAFFATLTLAAAVAVAATGLSGQDIELDRTAGFNWLPRRLGHLLLIGVLAGGVLLVVQAPGDTQVAASVVLRDGAGLLGLAGLAATLLGGQFGWTFPLLWTVVALFVPSPDPKAVSGAVAWPLLPAEASVSWWMAGILFGAGTAVYTLAGARR